MNARSQPPAETSADPIAPLTGANAENVMVAGAPLSGKRHLAVRVARDAAADGRDVLFVATARTPPQSLTSVQSAGSVRVVDCTPSECGDADVEVGTPADLTGISMPVSRFVETATDPVVVLDSVSAMLMYVEEASAFRFLSVLATHLRRADGLGLFTVDELSHEESTVRTFAQLFGGRLDLEAVADGTRARAVGLGALPDGAFTL